MGKYLGALELRKVVNYIERIEVNGVISMGLLLIVFRHPKSS